MDKRKRRFRRGEHQEEELRLDDVLEPYDQDEPADDEQSGQTFAPYEDEAGPLYGAAVLRRAAAALRTGL